MGGALLALTAYGGFELTHQYVERVKLQPEVDEEIKKYQWDVSGEVWQADPVIGGTDPALGYAGRHALRAAWMAHNWGVGPPELSDIAEGVSPADIPDLYAAEYLRRALRVAEDKATSSQLRPLTIPALYNLSASLLERMGNAFPDLTKDHFELAWRGYSGQGLRAAHIALKLGDISFRRHQNEEAQKWWKISIQLSQGSATPNSVGALLEPTTLPSSPWAQRIVASTLISLSAFYAQTGKLKDAENFEEHSLAYLRSIPTPDSITQASPPQALHALFLLQRSSLLSIHLAEVLSAQKKSILSSIQYLTAAAESSERVARALAGLPLHQNAGTPQLEVPKGEDQISSIFSSSPSMRPVASRLYRDAKRTSAEAWNLLGVLYEQKEGSASKSALQCYERAVEWAGKREGEGISANEAVTEKDWKVFWSNYQKAKMTAEK
ncbi:hypothetical protein EST38_g10792 [Candolleomyces aberdarensis]|uniref:Uncharacterized protein n=1 Tax=Candolleomyces aberdarensis TaxID=2316362 RepID=A0A4Q2D838_9AGAR|nr:hypothetical protein EST38_g10792 [Candolleomyces aberdarensis]